MLLLIQFTGCTFQQEKGQIKSELKNKVSSLQPELFINQGCQSINCTSTIQPITRKGNELQLQCEYLSPQKMNVTIQWVFGSNIRKTMYYLTCWQSSEIGFIVDTVGTKKIESRGMFSELSFDGLNMDRFSYTVALRIGKTNSQDQNNYPVSVQIPEEKTKGQRIDEVWKSTNQVSVTPVDFTDNTFRCVYQIPKGNAPYLMENNYIILFRDEVSPYFDKMKIEDWTSYRKVMSTSGGTKENIDLPLSKELKHGQIYTVAYLMGQEGDTIPNLNGLVAWNTFIAN